MSEECDDGQNGVMVDNDGCNTSCEIEFCGDNEVQSNL